MFVKHLRVELFQLRQQDLVFPPDVLSIARHHEEEQRVSFNVAQEAQSQTTPFGGSFNDTRNVGHDKRFAVTIRHHAETRLHGGERIVGYFGSRGRERGNQRGFPGVGKTHQAHVGQQFQFQNHHHFLHRLAGLRVTRSLIGGSAELPVAQSAPASFQQHHHLSVGHNVTNVFARFGVIGHSAWRNVNVAIGTVRTMRTTFGTVATIAGKHMAFVAQVEQCPIVMVATQIDVAAASAITAIRSAVGLVFGAVHVHGTSAALSGAAINFHVVDKVRFGHVKFGLWWGSGSRDFQSWSITAQSAALISSKAPYPFTVWRLPSASYHAMSGVVCAW